MSTLYLVVVFFPAHNVGRGGNPFDLDVKDNLLAEDWEDEEVTRGQGLGGPDKEGAVMACDKTMWLPYRPFSQFESLKIP